MESLINTLTQIGLSDKEAQVYCICLELGAQPASIIAKKCELPRSTIYDTVNSLIDKGLAYRTEKQSGSSYGVLSPDTLTDYLDHLKLNCLKRHETHKRALTEILPELTKFQISDDSFSKPIVKYYEGSNSFRKAYEESLYSSETIRNYANISEIVEHLPIFAKDYIQKRQEANIFAQVISPDTPESIKCQQDDKKEYRETRLIPAKHYTFAPEVSIYDNKVAYILWHEKIIISIESEQIAQYHKQNFDLTWNLLAKN